MRRIATRLIVAAALLGSPLGSPLGLAPKPAAADQITYGFSAFCIDCNQQVRATLVLDGYTPSSALAPVNFVAFAYGGSSLLAAFAAPPMTLYHLSGSLPAIGDAAPATFLISLNGPGGPLSFSSLATGAWDIRACQREAVDGCAAGGAIDYGTSHSWAVVPAPGGLGLFALGLAALYPIARRTSAKA